MAIEKTIALSNGITVENAYIRVDTVSGYKGGIDYSMNSYVSKEAFQAGMSYVEQEVLHFTPDVSDNAPNFIKQAYENAKMTEKYSGGKDC